MNKKTNEQNRNRGRDTWNRQLLEGGREDWMKEGEGISQRTYICMTQGHRQHHGDCLKGDPGGKGRKSGNKCNSINNKI